MSWTRPWRRDTEASSTAPIEKIDGNTAKASNNSVLDVYTSTIASLGRTVLIQKLILLPKLKAAAFFQPEDSLKKDDIKLLKGSRVLSPTTLQWIGRGGIFASGCLLFLGHDAALHILHKDKHFDIDNAPILSSFIAGAFGGSLYAAISTPILNIMRTKRSGIRSLFAGLKFTMTRDIGGFAIYFGSYTYLRHLGHTYFETTGNNLDYSDMELSRDNDHLQHLPRSIAISCFAGGGAGLATYIWRSPWDTLFKIRRGMRAQESALVSAKRFLNSPRGAKAVALGSVTWGLYEGTWAVLQQNIYN